MVRKNLKKGQPVKEQRKQYQPPKNKFKKNFYFDIVGFAVIILLGTIIYSNSFNCSFHLDDSKSIVENMNIRNLSDVKSLWQYSQTRFLPYYTFAVNYHFGGLNVWGYHLVNLVIHIFNACLVYWLTWLIFSSPALKNNAVVNDKKVIAFITAILFVSHPLATQSVTYIVQRMASMVALFYLLSLALYIQARLTGKSNLLKYVLFTASIVSAAMALRTKENAFTLPFAIVFFEIFFLQTKKLSINFKDYRVILCIAGLLGFMLIFLSKYSFSIFKPILPDSTNDYRMVTSQNYLFTQFSVIVKYIQLLFLPVNQNLDYDFKISNSFFELRTIMSFLFLLLLIILALFLYKKNRVISFGIFWFFLTLSVESGIIPISDLIFEHRTYLPSFGFFLILSCGIYMLLWNKYKYFAIFLFAILLGSYSLLTYERNKVWKDDYTLWSDVISKSPGKPRAFNNRGNMLMNDKRYEEALNDFNKAIELNPIQERVYNNRGKVLFLKKKYEQALNDYNKAIELEPGFAEAYFNRGIILAGENNFNQAQKDYNKAIELNVNYIEAYVNRGNLFRNEARYNEALRDYKKAIELRPEFSKAYYNRALLFVNQKKFADAIVDFSKVIELKSDDLIESYYNRGMAEYFTGNKESGCMDLKEAAQSGYQPASDFMKQFCR